MKGGVGHEKYNESVLSNTAFINELKSKLPEFFNDNDQFDMDKFKASLQEHNVDELKDGYQLNFIGKDYDPKINIVRPYNTENGDFVYHDKFEYFDEKLKVRITMEVGYYGDF